MTDQDRAQKIQDLRDAAAKAEGEAEHAKQMWLAGCYPKWQYENAKTQAKSALRALMACAKDQ